MTQRERAIQILAVAAAHMNMHQWASFEERMIMVAAGGVPILLDDQKGRAERLVIKMEAAHG